MKKRIAVVLSVIALSVLGAASPALADSNWSISVYNQDGLYVGCISRFTGHFFTVDEITELGCNTDAELN